MTEQTAKDRKDKVGPPARPRRRPRPQPLNPHHALLVERELSHPGG